MDYHQINSGSSNGERLSPIAGSIQDLDDLDQSTVSTEKTPLIKKKKNVDNWTQSQKFSMFRISTATTEFEEVDAKVVAGKSEDSSIRTGNIWTAIFNFTNAPMGAGMLSFPYTFLCTGFVAGLAISLLIILLTFLTLHILIDVSFSEGGFRSYQQCIQHHLGKFWKKVCEVILLFYATGICVVYIMVIAQFIKPVVDIFASGREDFYSDERMIMVFFSIVVIYPLVLLRQIKKLGFTSFIAVGGALYLAVFMIGTGIYHIATGSTGPDQRKLFWIQGDMYPNSFYPFLFLAIPLKCFGYQNHVLMFPISYEIKKGNTKKMDKVMFISVFLVSIIYLSTGIFGWFAFGSDVQDNILNNFAGDNIFADICRIACGINVVFSFPVQNYGARLAIKSIFWGDSNVKLGTFSHILISTGYFLFVVIVAVFVPGLSVIFGFIGSIGAVTLMFFFPSILCWVVLSKKYYEHKWKVRAVAIFVFVVAVFFCTTGLIAATMKSLETFRGKKVT